MLNSKQERELCYVTIVDAVTPIEGYDRVELAHVGGWTVVVGKGEFKAGDPAVYFEIDSKLPEVEPFTNMEFLAKKKYKIKTQKMCKSLSQGLLLSAEKFGWTIESAQFAGGFSYIVDDKGIKHIPEDKDTMFLTKQLGITYAIPEDNKRKSNGGDKYKKMAQRHGKLFSKQPFRWLMRRTWGKKLLFVFFGKKKDKRNWPTWVAKTDEERIENLPYLFNDKTKWIATEKIDGTSTTFNLKRGKGFKKEEFYICSRNVVFEKPDQKCYYETNVYTEMAEKYDIYNKMKDLLTNLFPNDEWITIQGETYGKGVQKRDYHITEHNFMAFNFITSNDGRWNTNKMKDLLEKYYGIPCVPVLDSEYVLPDSLEELRKYVDSETSIIDGDIREGIVFRSQDGVRSFKCVSPTYLIKYHQ